MQAFDFVAEAGGFLELEVKGSDEIRYVQKQKKWVSVPGQGKEHVIKKDP